MIRRWILLILLSSGVAMAHSSVQVVLSTKMPLQGDAIQVMVKTPQPMKKVTVRLNKHAFVLFDNKTATQFSGWIGVSRYEAPGKKRLNITVEFRDNTTHTDTIPIHVGAANFKKEHITLTPQKNKINRNQTSRTNENTVIRSKFNTISPRQYSQGGFMWPVEGRVTSEFGTQRVYNNRPGWMHSGIDISKKTGAPIRATQRGRVSLAQSFLIHGKTVMIDHGHGIVSIYNHMNRIDVTSNQMVNQGDIIGTVGSTGVSTGSHLHFGISIQSVRVNPRSWIGHGINESMGDGGAQQKNKKLF